MPIKVNAPCANKYEFQVLFYTARITHKLGLHSRGEVVKVNQHHTIVCIGQRIAPIMMNAPKFVTIIIFALFLQGCSWVTMGYNNFDVYLRYKIGGYASFTTSQQTIIRQEVADYMAWHRQHALPEYIIFLKDVELLTRQTQPPSSTDIARLRARVNTLYITSILPAITPAANVLSTLDESQITQFEKKLAEDNTKLEQELLDHEIEKTLEKRVQRTIDFFEQFVGNLNADQEEKIRAASLRLPFITEIFLNQRKASQVKLLSMLHNKATAETIAEFLNSLTFTPELARMTNEQVLIEQFKRESDEFIAKSYAMLRADQKQTFQKNIASYIEDFQKLHKAILPKPTR